ncbi:MAG TPA: RecB family exonuclease [Nakamurella sp.]|nr:RecB family exonuclease [Nakamurella sp.]
MTTASHPRCEVIGGDVIGCVVIGGDVTEGGLPGAAPAVDGVAAALPEDCSGSSETAGDESDPPRVRRPLALSPSRATDFKTCPLLYRYRAVDRLPEAPSAPAVRGTLVHSTLERMFGRPAEARTPDLTVADVEPLWEQMATEYPQLAELIPAKDLPGWLTSARDLVRTYFSLEDPRRFTPEACELAIEIEVRDGVPLRGFVDRLDRAATGQLRVVDYKTGRSPGPDFEAKALYQLKFYALMIFRMRGVIPAQLKLIYLADALSLTYSPSEEELVAFEAGVAALWEAIVRARRTGDFPPRQSRVCEWCSYQAFCPEFGGTSPPYPGVPEREHAEAGAAVGSDSVTEAADEGAVPPPGKVADGR